MRRGRAPDQASISPGREGSRGTFPGARGNRIESDFGVWAVRSAPPDRRNLLGSFSRDFASLHSGLFSSPPPGEGDATAAILSLCSRSGDLRMQRSNDALWRREPSRCLRVPFFRLKKAPQIGNGRQVSRTIIRIHVLESVRACLRLRSGHSQSGRSSILAGRELRIPLQRLGLEKLLRSR